MRTCLIFGMLLVATAGWGQLASPTIFPPAGTYTIDIPGFLSGPTGSTLCWTQTGVAPTTNGAGVCTSGNTQNGIFFPNTWMRYSISSATWSANTVTLTVGNNVAQTGDIITVANVGNSGYDSGVANSCSSNNPATFTVLTATTGSSGQLTYTLTCNPGGSSSGGLVQDDTTNQIQAVATQSGQTDSSVATFNYSTANSATITFITHQPLGNCLQNVANFCWYEVVASGGTAPYTWALSSGSLPAGMTMCMAGAGGCPYSSTYCSGSFCPAIVYGTATAVGQAKFVLSVTDNASNVSYIPLYLNVTAPIVGEPNPTPPALFSGSTAYSLPTGMNHVISTAAALKTLLQTPTGCGGQTGAQTLHYGDIITLTAGFDYGGPFYFCNLGTNSSNQYVYVQTSAYSSLPSPGACIVLNAACQMSTYEPYMAVFSTNHNGPAVLICGGDDGNCTTDGANYYRFIGIEVKNEATGGGFCNPRTCNAFASNLIDFSTSAATNPRTSTEVDHIIIDRCYIHGDSTHDENFGVIFDGTNIALIDSQVSDIHWTNNEAHAIITYYSNGPAYVNNSVIEASTESYFNGGGGACYETGCSPFFNNPYQPADLTFTYNYVYHQLSQELTCGDGSVVQAGEYVGDGSRQCPSGSASLSACSCAGGATVSCTFGAGTSHLVTGDNAFFTKIVSSSGNWNANDVPVTISGSSVSYSQACSGSYTSGGTMNPTLNQWVGKNDWELKTMNRANVSFNQFVNNIPAGQNGAAILLTVRPGQSSGVLDNVNFHDNQIINSTFGLSTLAADDLCGSPTAAYPGCTNPGEMVNTIIKNNVFSLSVIPGLPSVNQYGIVLDGGSTKNSGIQAIELNHNSIFWTGGAHPASPVYAGVPLCSPPWNYTYNVWINNNAPFGEPSGDCGDTGGAGLALYYALPSWSDGTDTRFQGNEMYCTSGTCGTGYPNNNDPTTHAIGYNANGSVNCSVNPPACYDSTFTTDGLNAGYNPPLTTPASVAGQIGGRVQ